MKDMVQVEGTSSDFRVFGAVLASIAETGLKRLALEEANYAVLCQIRDSISGQILTVPVTDGGGKEDIADALLQTRMIMLIPETDGNVSLIADEVGVTRTLIYKRSRFPRFWEYLRKHRSGPRYKADSGRQANS